MVASQNFLKEHSGEHSAAYEDDIRRLKAVSLPQHTSEDHLARLYLENKYRINLSKPAANLLIHFLEETREGDGGVVLHILNRRIELRVTTARPAMFFTTGEEEVLLGEDEGITGHTSGRLEVGGALPPVRIGLLPMSMDYMADVEEELREEDARVKDAMTDDSGAFLGGTLLEEFQKIKREESEDSPMRDHIPLPPYTGVDIEREVRLVKESRDKVKLNGVPGPALPTICMYTFHNTQDGYVGSFPSS